MGLKVLTPFIDKKYLEVDSMSKNPNRKNKIKERLSLLFSLLCGVLFLIGILSLILEGLGFVIGLFV